jgi:hypothetical protein
MDNLIAFLKSHRAASSFSSASHFNPAAFALPLQPRLLLSATCSSAPRLKLSLNPFCKLLSHLLKFRKESVYKPGSVSLSIKLDLSNKADQNSYSSKAKDMGFKFVVKNFVVVLVCLYLVSNVDIEGESNKIRKNISEY